MSGVFQRMIGRATGAAPSGLRPRLPSRFETDLSEGGFAETAAEIPATAAPDAPEAVRPDAPRQRRATRPAPTPPEAAPTTPPEPHRAVRPAPAPPEAAPAPLSEGENAPAPPPPVLPLAVHAHPMSPAPDLQEPAPPHEPPASGETIPTTRSPADAATPDQPRPLLPPDPTGARAPEILPGAIPAPDMRLGDATEQAPSEPEITIHIGQLDLRTQPPHAPKPRPRATPAGTLPSLADYLRGGRS